MHGLFERGLVKHAAVFLCVWLSAIGLAASVRIEKQTLFVNEMAVMTVRHGNAQKRLQIALAALAKAGNRPIAKAVKRESRAFILIGDTSIFRVEPEDAKLAKSSAYALASQWASNINKALTLPPLKVSESSFRLGAGQKKKLYVSGRLAKGAVIECSDEGVASIERTSDGAILTGQNAGSATVVVSTEEKLVSIGVRVLPLAAQFPQSATAEVTGVPCTGSVAAGAVEAAVFSQVVAHPSVDLKFEVPTVGQVRLGETVTIPVRVRAISSEALDTAGLVYVRVKNVPQFIEPESELWYCNNPESVRDYGQLFGVRLNTKKPARMLFHHMNAMSRGLLFHIQLINTSDAPARLLVIPGDSPIHKNPVKAGIDAAEAFFRNWLFSAGEIVTIPAKSSMPLSLRRLEPQETVSGLTYMALLSGGPESVFVRTDAKPTFHADGKWAQALQSDTPWRILGSVPIRMGEDRSGVLTDHVYPEPFKSVEMSYQVGGRHGFARVGQQPIPNSNGKRHLDGNFGVVYTIKADIENRTTRSANVEVVFEASAGYSGALFAVEGRVYRTPLIKAKQQARILKMNLAPGTNKKLTMRTIPLSGSSYPITLSIRPIDRLDGPAAIEAIEL